MPRDPKISECLAMNKGMWDNCDGFNSYKKDIFISYTIWKEKEENLKHPMRKFMTYIVDPFESD